MEEQNYNDDFEFIKIKSYRVYESVVNQLKTMIKDEKLKHNQRLPSERELAQRLGIGRTSVREALRVLEVEGLIEIRLGIGTFVKDRSSFLAFDKNTEKYTIGSILKEKEDVRNLYEAREAIEPIMAGLAAERITKGDIESFTKYFNSIKKSVDNNTLTIEEDQQFHFLLAECTKNHFMKDILIFIMRSLTNQLTEYIKMPGRMKKSFTEHQKIFEALKENDTQKARKLMEEHLVSRHLKLND